MLFRTSASVIALVACTSLAAAADLNGPSYGGSLKDDYAAPAAHSWTGLYVGFHAGYGWGEHSGSGYYEDTKQFSGSFDLDGALAGGQIGFNLQSGSFLIGIEGDGSWAKIDGSGSFTFDAWEAPGPEYTWNIDTDVEWLASLRGRIGLLVSPNFLIYGTGGVAWAGIDVHQQTICHARKCGRVQANPNPIQTTNLRSSETVTGWVAGLGAEWKLAQNLSVKAEWQHYDFGDVDAKLSGIANGINGLQAGPNDPEFDPNYKSDSFPGDIKLDVIRVGVNYKFGN